MSAESATVQVPADPALDPASASARTLAFVDRWRWWLFGVVVALHVAAFTGRWRPGYDSAEFLILSRKLRTHGNMRTLGGEAHGVLPGYPGLLSVLGEDPTGPALFVNAAGVLAWLFFIFAFVRRVCGRPTAVLVTLLCGVSARTMEASADVMPGLLFATAVAGVLWAESWPRGAGRMWLKWVVIGVFVLWAASLRSVAVFVVGALVASATMTWVLRHGVPRRLSAWLLIVGALGAAVAVFFVVPALRSDVFALLDKFRYTGVSGLAASIWEAVRAAVPEAVWGLDMSAYVGWALGLAALGAGVALVRQRVFWGVLVLAMAAPWLLFIASPRYVIPVLPLLWLGMWSGMVSIEKRWPGAGTGWAVFVALGLSVASNLIGVGHLILEQRASPFYAAFRDGKYAPARDAADWLRDNTPPGARVVITQPERTVLTWWSGRVTLDAVNRAAERAGMLFAVTPLDEDAHRALKHRRWQLGVPLLVTPPDREGVAWTLHEVDRSATLGEAQEREQEQDAERVTNP